MAMKCVLSFVVGDGIQQAQGRTPRRLTGTELCSSFPERISPLRMRAKVKSEPQFAQKLFPGIEFLQLRAKKGEECRWPAPPQEVVWSLFAIWREKGP